MKRLALEHIRGRYLPTVPPLMPVQEALLLLEVCQVEAVIVVAGQLCGVATLSDLLYRAPGTSASEGRARRPSLPTVHYGGAPTPPIA